MPLYIRIDLKLHLRVLQYLKEKKHLKILIHAFLILILYKHTFLVFPPHHFVNFCNKRFSAGRKVKSTGAIFRMFKGTWHNSRRELCTGTWMSCSWTIKLSHLTDLSHNNQELPQDPDGLASSAGLASYALHHPFRVDRCHISHATDTNKLNTVWSS